MLGPMRLVMIVDGMSKMYKRMVVALTTILRIMDWQQVRLVLIVVVVLVGIKIAEIPVRDRILRNAIAILIVMSFKMGPLLSTVLVVPILSTSIRYLTRIANLKKIIVFVIFKIIH